MTTNREKAEDLVRGWMAFRALGSFIDRPDEGDIIGRVEQALSQAESGALERAAVLLDEKAKNWPPFDGLRKELVKTAKEIRALKPPAPGGHDGG